MVDGASRVDPAHHVVAEIGDVDVALRIDRATPLG
jgi:hypothetical protein